MLLSPLLSRRMTFPPRWVPTEFSELPALDGGDSEDERDWLLLTGGLALLLSRCTPRGAQRTFPACLQAYRGLKPQLKQSARSVRLPLQVLSELRHEIAGVADAATCAAARRCMERMLIGVRGVTIGAAPM
jgi:hypothetical protein